MWSPMICKFSELYYNFIAIELGKFKIFHYFALQKRYLFLKIRWIFIQKEICILRN